MIIIMDQATSTMYSNYKLYYSEMGFWYFKYIFSDY